MSDHPSAPWVAGAAVAKAFVRALEPVAEQVVVAGSLRRRRPQVRDVELVIRPRMVTGDLFGGEAPDLDPIRHALGSLGTFRKNGDRQIQVLTPAGWQVDAFIVHPPAEWGTILAIRTGPAELGTWAVTRMRRLGRRCVGGHVETSRTGERVPTPTEEDFFRAAGLACLPPEQRDTREARYPL